MFRVYHVPQPLVDQLARGGRLVMPVGELLQDLLVIEKRRDGSIGRESLAPVRFVPLRGEAEKVPKEKDGGTATGTPNRR